MKNSLHKMNEETREVNEMVNGVTDPKLRKLLLKKLGKMEDKITLHL